MEIPTKVTNDGKLVLLIPLMGSTEETTIGDMGELVNNRKNLDMQAPREGLVEDKAMFDAYIQELESKTSEAV